VTGADGQSRRPGRFSRSGRLPPPGKISGFAVGRLPPAADRTGARSVTPPESGGRGDRYKVRRASEQEMKQTRLTNAQDKRIRAVRDAEGLSWTAIGERFQVSGSCARAAYMRTTAPTHPKRWRTAATRLGITADEYARRREANQRLCGRCDQWFDQDSDQYRSGRWACVSCLKRDDAAKRKRLSDDEREARRAETAAKRAKRTAEQMQRLDDQLLETIRGNRQRLGPCFQVADLFGLVANSHVTIRARLRRLEARGALNHTADGWRLA